MKPKLYWSWHHACVFNDYGDNEQVGGLCLFISLVLWVAKAPEFTRCFKTRQLPPTSWGWVPFITCPSDGDGGGENICSVNLRGQAFLLCLLSSQMLRLLRTQLECQARALNLARCSAPERVPGCQPSVCLTVQLPCHHHYHQSELQRCPCACLCVFARVNGCMLSFMLPSTYLSAFLFIQKWKQAPVICFLVHLSEVSIQGKGNGSRATLNQAIQFKLRSQLW